jgi:hypothetical protein
MKKTIPEFFTNEIYSETHKSDKGIYLVLGLLIMVGLAVVIGSTIYSEKNFDSLNANRIQYTK